MIVAVLALDVLSLDVLMPGKKGQKAPPIEYYRLVAGFLPENKNADGRAVGTGFASPNPGVPTRPI